MSELETRLAELRVEWPPEPDVAARVRARLEAEPPPRAAFGGPPGRSPLAILRARAAAWPRSRRRAARCCAGSGSRACGSSACRRRRRRRRPSSPRSTSASGRRSRAATLVPGALGRPDAVYADGDQVTLLYRPRRGLPESAQTGAGALLSQFPGRTHPELIRKLAGPGTTIERVRVDGEPGYWLGGDVHSLIYEDPSGDIRESPMRLAGPTLVWRRGELTLRLEADVTKSRALAIARSVQ